MITPAKTQLVAAGWVVLLALGGCTTIPALPPEPVNLSVAKAAVEAYADDGRYLRDLSAVASQVNMFLAQRAARGKPDEKLAVVFDLDETLLSNLPHMRALDFGYLPEEWNAWVGRGEAPVIEPVRGVYRTARKLGMDIFLITGRQEVRDRAGTEKNLRAAGLTGYTVLMLKSDDAKISTAEFKTEARRLIASQGYVIVANIGDQKSDLAGGFAERTFKLPDPFYLIP